MTKPKPKKVVPVVVNAVELLKTWAASKNKNQASAELETLHNNDDLQDSKVGEIESGEHEGENVYKLGNNFFSVVNCGEVISVTQESKKIFLQKR